MPLLKPSSTIPVGTAPHCNNPTSNTPVSVEYLEVVNDAIEATDAECLETIKAGFEEIAEFLQDPNGTTYISELFRICDDDVDISVEPERAYFFTSIVYSWAGIVQYASGSNIQDYCDVIKQTEGTDSEKLLAFLESRYGKYDCLDSYYDYVKEYQNTELTRSAGTASISTVFFLFYASSF